MTQDELDQQSITQLHSAVLEFSKNCFELKKLCATVVASSLTLLTAFADHRKGTSDTVFFFGTAIIIAFFWIADSQSYYYQEKLRIYMKTLQQSILARGTTKLIFDGVGMPVSASRQASPAQQRIIHAIFNASMAFYYGLLAIDGVAFLAYHFGALHLIP